LSRRCINDVDLVDGGSCVYDEVGTSGHVQGYYSSSGGTYLTGRVYHYPVIECLFQFRHSLIEIFDKLAVLHTRIEGRETDPHDIFGSLDTSAAGDYETTSGESILVEVGEGLASRGTIGRRSPCNGSAIQITTEVDLWGSNSPQGPPATRGEIGHGVPSDGCHLIGGQDHVPQANLRNGSGISLRATRIITNKKTISRVVLVSPYSIITTSIGYFC